MQGVMMSSPVKKTAASNLTILLSLWLFQGMLPPSIHLNSKLYNLHLFDKGSGCTNFSNKWIYYS
jgi:hypothetical protein